MLDVTPTSTIWMVVVAAAVVAVAAAVVAVAAAVVVVPHSIQRLLYCNTKPPANSYLWTSPSAHLPKSQFCENTSPSWKKRTSSDGSQTIRLLSLTVTSQDIGRYEFAKIFGYRWIQWWGKILQSSLPTHSSPAFSWEHPNQRYFASKSCAHKDPMTLKIFQTAWQDHSLRFWLKPVPNVKLWRLLGRVTPSRFWLKCVPNVKLWRLLGRATSCRLWLKASPNVKLWRLLGRVTCSRLWLNQKPKVRVWRLFGRVTPSRFWLKLKPNFKVWRLFAGLRVAGSE